jgi:hypothetical protein
MPFSPQTYQRLWIASLLVTMLLAAWTGISAVGGDRLGLSPQTMAWMGIGAGVLGMLLGFLPPLQKTPSQNEQVVQQVQTARRLAHVAQQAQHIPPTPPDHVDPESRLTQTTPPARPQSTFSETITRPSSGTSSTTTRTNDPS